MSLIRFTPRRDNSIWRPFADLQSEINRLFSEGVRSSVEPSFMPPIDVLESENGIVIKADLPGLRREDVQVSIEEGVLSIRGKREEKSEVKENGFVHVERAVGQFLRSVTLPFEVDQEKVKASFKDGVLTVEAPKSAAALPRTIEISAN
ncbi:Hsp20/alpha crystallin family protein [Candidatus Sumerlaeota bacterium]|nr:Hsp20/alpha crystallin family protein [Candidatus Sumerlaeota bacterium]